MVKKSGHYSHLSQCNSARSAVKPDLDNRWRWMRWGLMASVVSVMAVVAQAGAALAEELTDWGYDSQTREINVVLPTTVAPSLSVIAPDQLLIELPDTQVGEVAGKSVGDGVVESIVLEQTTPETVWMVVEFVPGTVLADVQNATQTHVGDGLRQWQVQPALMASRRTVATPIAVMPADRAIGVSGSAADSLRSPSATVAQAGDFSDLPVLEPAMPMNEPVSVPPIDVSPEVAPPDIAPTVEAMPIEIPVISDAELLDSDSSVADEGGFEPDFETGVADEIAADEIAADEIAVDEIEADEVFTAEDPLPFEPPFIGEVGNGGMSEPVVEVPAIAPPAAGQIAELPPSEPWQNESAAVVEPAPVVEIPVQTVTPNNVERWPEPVPFGQPLP